MKTAKPIQPSAQGSVLAIPPCESVKSAATPPMRSPSGFSSARNSLMSLSASSDRELVPGITCTRISFPEYSSSPTRVIPSTDFACVKNELSEFSRPAPSGRITSIGLPSKLANRSSITCELIAARSDAGSTRESTCAKAIFTIGNDITMSNASEPTTTGTGRAITARAVFAQRPSSFGARPPLRITPLSTRLPKIARRAGSGMSAPKIAKSVTTTPA